jgi:hypothetical protein
VCGFGHHHLAFAPALGVLNALNAAGITVASSAFEIVGAPPLQLKELPSEHTK